MVDLHQLLVMCSRNVALSRKVVGAVVGFKTVGAKLLIAPLSSLYLVITSALFFFRWGFLNCLGGLPFL